MSVKKYFNRRKFLLGGTLLAGAMSLAKAQTLQSSGQKETVVKNLKGKAILITGCSSGFGRLSAEHFARLGATVYATMRNLPRPEATELETIAKRDNLAIQVIELDVLLQESIDNAVAQVLKKSTVDAVINNAGIGITGPVEVQDMQATELAFNTNVYGPHRVIRAVLPAMREQGFGHIINISSQLGRLILPGAGHYSATKFALEAMSEQLAYELVPQGIDVTIIQPGGYPTNIWVNRNRYNKSLKARIAEKILKAYPQLVARMVSEDGAGSNTDPMDIPHVIAEIMSMPAGKRPLRRAVHPTSRPQEPINEVMAQTQLSWLGKSPVGAWIKSVLG